MTLTNEQLEWVVREVIRRLTGGAAASPTTLVIDDQVVTLSTLDGRLNGAATVTVKKNAIVTPSVKDELRHRGIKLQRTNAN